MKKFLALLALILVIVPMSGSVSPKSISTPVVKTRASLITPEALAQFKQPVSDKVKSAAPILISNVRTIDDARAWIYQTCPAVHVATIPGKASFYVPQNSAIAIGSDTEEEYLSFVIAHEMSHHYQWIFNNGDLTVWNKGMRSEEGLPPTLEVQADYMASEVLGSLPAIANYAKSPATQDENKEALTVLNFGKSHGC